MEYQNYSGQDPLKIAERMAHANSEQCRPTTPGERLDLVVSQPEAKFAKPELLPACPVDRRPQSDYFTRSALFSPGMKNNQKSFQETRINCLKGFGICYTGQRLGQADMEVFNELVFMASRERLTTIKLSVSAVLRSMGRGRGSNAKASVVRSLNKLFDAHVSVNSTEKVFEGRLLASLLWVEEGKRNYFVFKLGDVVEKLFEPGAYTTISVIERANLKNQSFALWLHAYASSHISMYPITSRRLRTLAGYDGPLSRWNAELKRALDLLSDLPGWRYVWRQGKLKILHPLSRTQAKWKEKNIHRNSAID